MFQLFIHSCILTGAIKMTFQRWAFIAWMVLLISSSSLWAQSGATTAIFNVGSLGIYSDGYLDLYDVMQSSNLDLYGVVHTAFSDISGNHAPPFPAINAAIIRGYNGGSWGGTNSVIISDHCKQNANYYGSKQGRYALASLNGLEYSVLGGHQNDFHGIAVENTAALVQLTYAGDVNFDGKVDVNDRIFENNYLANPPSVVDWSHGDLNYDGLVNGDDLAIVNQAINYQSAHGTFSRLNTGIVPEPSTLSLLGIGFLSLLACIRRRKKTGK
jgi:hypothetical protein